MLSTQGRQLYIFKIYNMYLFDLTYTIFKYMKYVDKTFISTCHNYLKKISKSKKHCKRIRFLSS